MTIIVYVDNTLIADRAAIGFGTGPLEACKVMHREQMVWGWCGTWPSMAMLRAQTLVDLVAAIELNRIGMWNANSSGLVIDSDRNAWLVTPYEHSVFVQPVSNGAAIGKYDDEWTSYSQKHGASKEAATAFCSIITRVWGFAAKCDAVSAMPIAGRRSQDYIQEGGEQIDGAQV